MPKAWQYYSARGGFITGKAFFPPPGGWNFGSFFWKRIKKAIS